MEKNKIKHHLNIMVKEIYQLWKDMFQKKKKRNEPIKFE